jgi:hypothetical protein
MPFVLSEKLAAIASFVRMPPYCFYVTCDYACSIPTLFSPSPPSIHQDRTEVVCDDSNPEFEQDLRLKPRPQNSLPGETDSPGTSGNDISGEDFFYEAHHVLSFSFYDSCRKDSLVSSSYLDDAADLDLMGTAIVSITDLLQRMRKQEEDPRISLILKYPLARDKNQSMMSKTFEQLGKGVNMVSSLNPFSIQPTKEEATLILNLAPIRCVSRGTPHQHSALPADLSQERELDHTTVLATGQNLESR